MRKILSMSLIFLLLLPIIIACSKPLLVKDNYYIRPSFIDENEWNRKTKWDISDGSGKMLLGVGMLMGAPLIFLAGAIVESINDPNADRTFKEALIIGTYIATNKGVGNPITVQEQDFKQNEQFKGYYAQIIPVYVLENGVTGLQTKIVDMDSKETYSCYVETVIKNNQLIIKRSYLDDDEYYDKRKDYIGRMTQKPSTMGTGVMGGQK